MEINLLAVVICAVVSMVIGTVWYGVLFSKQWEEIIGTKGMTREQRAEMQKKAMPLYGVAFILALFQVWVLSEVMIGEGAMDGIKAFVFPLWILAGFVLPTVAGGIMWTNDSRRIAWMRFGIQSGYYIVLFIVWALILSAF